ncbi:hypothetical protein ACRS8P_16925 [Burkholderia cenocepacia]
MSEEVSRPDDGGRFINLWELLAQIGKAEAIYAYEAARDLVSCLSNDPASINYIRHRDELGILCPLEIDARLRLLRLLGIFGSHATLFDADGIPNDEAQATFERFGFYASDIYPFLARHDVAVSCPGDEDSESRVFPDGRPVPRWILAYEGQAWIPYGRVVGILTASTVAAARNSPDHDDVFDRWEKALSDAVERRVIGETTVSGKRMLVHSDVRVWFAQQNRVWPLDAPESQPAGTPSAVVTPEQQTPNISAASENSRNHTGKRERQIEMIKAVVDELGYQHQQIPDRGKQEIHKRCHSRDPHLFTENKQTFNGIWSDALEAGAVRMAKHNLYARK